MHKRRGVLLAVILGMFLLLPLMAEARTITPIDSGWTKTNAFTTQTTAILNAVTDDGAGTYVAVGNLGIILRSTNGTNWGLDVPTSTTGKNLWGIAYGTAGAFTGFIAVGDAKTIVFRKTTDSAWTPLQPTGIVGNLKAITFGQGLFVAVGDNGGVFTYNGNAGNIWVRQALTVSGTPITANGLLSVIYTQDRFTAVGVGGTVLVSYDGYFWERFVVTSGGTLQGIAFGGNIWIAVNSAATVFASTDGLSFWTAAKSAQTGILAGNLKGITYAGGQFMAVGNKGSIYKLDPVWGWLAADVPTRPATASLNITTNLRAIGSDGTVFYAVGEGGTILTTTDSDQWYYASTSNPTARLTGAAFGGGMFVTAGQYGNLFSSTDAITWLESRLTKAEDNTLPFIESVTYGDGLFVAVGDADSLGTGTPVPPIFTSTDGLTWTQQSQFTFAFATDISNRDLFGVVAGTFGGNPLYVAVGTSGTIISSPDGVNWTNRSISTSNFNAVAFGANTFVAAGDKGVIYYSTDGAATWHAATLGTTAPYFQSITFGNGTFVATAANGSIYYAADPTGTWNKATFLTANSAALYGVVYGAGTNPGQFAGFVAVGAGGIVWESTDGASWAKVTTGSGVATNLEAITFGNNRFVAAGGASVILTKSLP